jgi:hypothetical protein
MELLRYWLVVNIGISVIGTLIELVLAPPLAGIELIIGTVLQFVGQWYVLRRYLVDLNWQQWVFRSIAGILIGSIFVLAIIAGLLTTGSGNGQSNTNIAGNPLVSFSLNLVPGLALSLAQM